MIVNVVQRKECGPWQQWVLSKPQYCFYPVRWVWASILTWPISDFIICRRGMFIICLIKCLKIKRATVWKYLAQWLVTVGPYYMSVPSQSGQTHHPTAASSLWRHPPTPQSLPAAPHFKTLVWIWTYMFLFYLYLVYLSIKNNSYETEHTEPGSPGWRGGELEGNSAGRGERSPVRRPEVPPSRSLPEAEFCCYHSQAGGVSSSRVALLKYMARFAISHRATASPCTGWFSTWSPCPSHLPPTPALNFRRLLDPLSDQTEIAL